MKKFGLVFCLCLTFSSVTQIPASHAEESSIPQAALPTQQTRPSPFDQSWILREYGSLPKALEEFDALLRKAQADDDPELQARALLDLARIYSALGNKKQALDYANKSLSLWQKQEETLWEMEALRVLGSIYAEQGDTPQAIDYYQQVIDLKPGDPKRNQSTLNRLLMLTAYSLGDVYMLDGDIEAAQEQYEKVLSYHRKNESNLLWRTILFDLTPYLIKHIAYLSEPTTFMKDGKVMQRQPPQLMTTVVMKDPKRLALSRVPSKAAVVRRLGRTHFALGNREESLKHYKKSLSLSRKSKDSLQRIETLAELGKFYDKLGDPNKSFEYYHRSLIDSHKEGINVNLSTLKNIVSVYRSKGEIVESLGHVNDAISIVEDGRRILRNHQLKTDFFAQVQGYYQLKVDLLMELHRQEPEQGYEILALQAAEQSRARSLRELLGASTIELNRELSPELKAREDQIQQGLAELERNLIELSSISHPKVASTKVAIQQAIQELLKQQRALISEIQLSNPEYAKLQYSEPAKPRDIRWQLGYKNLLLKYHLGEEKSYLWVADQSRFNVYELPPKAEIEAAVKAFRAALIDTDSLEFPSVTAGKTLDVAAKELTQKILAPAAKHLRGQQLLIVPDGALQTVPFAALANPSAAENSLGLRLPASVQNQYRPLISSHDISYLPAASLIFPMHPEQEAAPKTLAILADPIFNLNDSRISGKSETTKQLSLRDGLVQRDALRTIQLARLHGTAKEAESILDLLSQAEEQTAVFGFESNYDWVTQSSLDQYQYIHLATHGIFNQNKPELSSLIFSLYNSEGEAQERAFLRLPETFNLNLAAEMVTLSACETGVGNDIPGEGLVGMTHGLLYSGAKRVTVSLWNVADRETAFLMERFYKSLWHSEQDSHVGALADAQRSMWKEGVHPYYWAAFVMQGEWRN